MSNTWNQLGNQISIPDSSPFDILAINTNGTIVAYANANHSIVKVYQYTGTWNQIGADIIGTFISLNSDGTKIAVESIGATNEVKIYQYNSVGNTWNQLGNTIMVDTFNATPYNLSLLDQPGFGLLVAIGEAISQLVKVYKYNSTTNTWPQFGPTITNTNVSGFGGAVSLTLQFDATDAFLVYQLIVGSLTSNIITVYDYDLVANNWIQSDKINLGTNSATGEFIRDNTTFNIASTPSLNRIVTTTDTSKTPPVTTTKIEHFSRFIMGTTNSGSPSAPAVNFARVYESATVTEPASVASTLPAGATSSDVTVLPTNPGGIPGQVFYNSLGLDITSPSGGDFLVTLQNNINAANSALSNRRYVFVSDTSLTKFLITANSIYNGKFFQTSNLQGTLSFSNGFYTFTQTGSVIGTVYDGATIIASNVTLTNGVFILSPNNLQGSADPNNPNVILVTDITGGIISQGTFTTPIPPGPPTLTLVSDTNVNTFNITFGDLNGATFDTSGIAGTLSGGTLSAGNTVLSGTTITQTNTVSGDLTIPSGPYAGTYSGVNLSSATFSNATVTGTFNSGTNTFSGTDVTAGDISAGTFDILFVTLTDTTPSLQFTISGGQFNGGTFTVTSGTFTSRYVNGTGVVTPTTLTGVDLTQIGSVVGDIAVIGSPTLTGVTLTDAMLTGVTATGSSTDNFFTATDVTSAVISNGASVFVVTYILVDDINSNPFLVATGVVPYDGQTFTTPLPFQPGWSGALSQNGILDPTYTTYSGASLIVPVCTLGTLSVSGAAAIKPMFFPIILSPTVVTGTLAGPGLIFSGTDVVSGTITSGDFFPAGTCP